MALDEFADALLMDPPPRKRRAAPVEDDPFADIPVATPSDSGAADPFADIPVARATRPAPAAPAGPSFRDYADALVTAREGVPEFRAPRVNIPAPMSGLAQPRETGVSSFAELADALVKQPDPNSRQARARRLRDRGEQMDRDGYPVLNRYARSVAGFAQNLGRGLQEYGPAANEPQPEVDIGTDGSQLAGPIVAKLGRAIEKAGLGAGRYLGAQTGPLESMRDIRSAGDAVKYAGNQAVNLLGSITGTVLTGGAGLIPEMQGEAAYAIDDLAEAQGVQVDPRKRAAASLLYGAAGAGLEAVSFGLMAKPFRRLLSGTVASEVEQRLAATAAREGLETAARNGGQSFMQRLARGAARTVAGAAEVSGGEAVTEGLQQAITSGVAPMAAGLEVDWKNVRDESLEAAVAAGAGAFLTGVPGAALGAKRTASVERELTRADDLLRTLSGAVKGDVAPGAAPAPETAPAAAQRPRTTAEETRAKELELALQSGGLAPDEKAAIETELAALPPRMADIGDGTPVPVAPAVPVSAPQVTDRRAEPRIGSRYEKFTDEELDAERRRLANLGPDADPFEGLFAPVELKAEMDRREATRTKAPLPTDQDPLPNDEELAFMHREIPDDVLEKRRTSELEQYLMATTPEVQGAIRRKIAIIDAERARRSGQQTGQQTPSTAPTPTSGVSVPRETQGTEARAAVTPRVGRKTVVLFPDGGTKLEAQYEVREADELVASHNPVTFQPDSRYPAEVQGRAYDKDKAAQDYVAQATLGYDPDKALDPTRAIGGGPTVITPDGIAVAGNQRLMIRQRASQQQPQRVAAYIAQLIENAAEYGINPDDIRAMKNPVLVRVITDKTVNTSDATALKELNRRSDEVDTKVKRATDEAAGTAAALGADSELMGFLSDAMAEDSELTLAEFFDTARGREFIRRLVVAEIIPRARVAQLIRGEPASGKLTDEGKGFVRRMLLAAALEDVTLLDRAPQKILLKMERVIPAIITSQRIPGYGLASQLRRALEVFADANDKGLTLAQSVDQIAFDAQPISPELKKLVLWLDKTDTKVLRERFQQYAENAQKYAVDTAPADEGGFDLGDTRITKTPEELLGDVTAANLFDTGDETGPGAALLAYVPKETAAELQADLFFGEKPKVQPPAGALVFDPSRKDAAYRQAWATVMDERERARVRADNPSRAFLDAFAFLRGNAKMLPEEARFRGDGQGSFLTDNADQGDMFAEALTDNGVRLPAFVDVNGKMRPTTNSEGRPIHPTIEGVVNFWYWFGDSKVVDDQGRPKVVYHGTARPNSSGIEWENLSKFRDGQLGTHTGSQRQAANFTATLEVAGIQETGGRVFPVYVRLENPIRLMDLGSWTVFDVLPQLQSMGLITEDESRQLGRDNWEAGYRARERLVLARPNGKAPTESEINKVTEEAKNDHLAGLLRSFGYDGVIYTNRYEGHSKQDVARYRLMVRERGEELTDSEYASEFPAAEDSYITPQPEQQIKSAIGNTGTFDPSEPSMVRQFDLDLFGPPIAPEPDDPSLPMAPDWTGDIPAEFVSKYGSDRNPILLVQMAQMFQRSGKQRQADDIIAELARRGVTRYGRAMPGGAPLATAVPIEPIEQKKDTADEPNLTTQGITAEAQRSSAIMRFRNVIKAMQKIPEGMSGGLINALNRIRPVRQETPGARRRTKEQAIALIKSFNPDVTPEQIETMLPIYLGPDDRPLAKDIYTGLRYFGVSFQFLEALENNTTLKLVGQKVNSVQDLAVMLLAVRDPFIEVGRTIFVDAEGRIVGHEVSTFGVPNRTSVIPTWLHEESVKRVNQKKIKTGLGTSKLTREETIALIQERYPTAVAFYDVHNHPNGSPVPSQGDLRATMKTSERLDTGVYLGGIVINGTTYSFVPSTVSPYDAANLHKPKPGDTFQAVVQRVAEKFTFPNGMTHDPLLTADPEFDDPRVWPYRGTDALMLGGKTSSDLARLIKEMYRPDLSPTIMVVLDAFRNVRAVVDVPNNKTLLKNKGAVEAYVQQMMASTGGSFVALATSDAALAKRANTVKGITSVLITPGANGAIDVQSMDGKALDIRRVKGIDSLTTIETGSQEGVASNLFDVMKEAANLGWLDRLTRVNMVTDKAIVTFNPAAEKQYKNNQGVPAAWKDRVRKAREWMKSLPETIPALGRPTRDAVTTLTNELLLMMRRTPAHSQQLAVDFIADVLEGFTKEQVDLFQRKLITDDLLKDIDAGLYTDEGGNPLPLFGRDDQGNRRPLADAVADLVAANTDVTNAIANDATVTAGLALMRQKRAALVRELVNEQMLSAEAVTDERYYHRQVLEFYRALDSNPGTAATRGIRQVRSGFQKRRSGGGEFNSLYVESEFEWLAQAFEKLLARKVEKQIKQVADQAPAMRRAAKDRNRNTFYRKIQPLVDDWMNGRPVPAWFEALMPSGPIMQLSLPFGTSFGTPVDPLASFRQRIAMNTARVYAETVNGSYTIAQLAPFAGLVRALEQWDAAGRQGYFDHPQWFAFLNAIASDDTLPGNLAAKGIYKAMQERDELIENIVGDAFVTGEDLEREAGLVSFQPVKGRTLYRASTLAEDVIDEILSGNRDLERDDLQEVLVQGGLKERWAVPKHIAAALNDPSNGLGRPGPYSIERVWMRGMALWKFWQLYSPTRFVKYNLNNTSSDLDVSFLYPKVMLGARNALSDLRAQADGVSRMSPQLRDELRLWQLHGAIDSGQYASELGDIWKHAEFEKLADPNPLSVMRLMGMYPRFVTGFATIRENTLRLAAARYFKAEMDRTGRIPTVIASNPKIVRNLWDTSPAAERTTIVAARLARDLIGDYQSISSAGSWARTRLLPFFAWQELNIKRYFWLMRNAVKDPEAVNSGALARVAGAALFRTTTNAALIALKVHVFYIAANLWNNWRYKDEEERLRRNGRGLHVIYGVDTQGDIGTLRLESAWAAFLKLVALEDYPADIKDIRDGKKSFSQQSKEMAQAPVSQFILALEPVTKGLYEGLAGVSLFPDPMNPRPSKEPLRDWLNGQGIGYIDDLYRTVSGEPIPPRKPGPLAEGLSPVERAVKTFDLFAGYRTDPGEAAYWNTRQMIAEYVRKETGRNLVPARLNEQQLAIYYAKAAARWGLEEKAQEWLAEYYKRGGTPLGARNSVQNMDPLQSLPNNIQGKFLRELSERDREMLRDARDWWRRDQKAAFRRVLTSVPYSQVRQQMRDENKP